jgi:hypothetical protein
MISQSEKTNPISKMPKMSANLYVIEDYENEPPSGPKKQTQTNPVLSAVEWANSPPISKILVLKFVNLYKILTTYEISS